jgi:hypothetical protein
MIYLENILFKINFVIYNQKIIVIHIVEVNYSKQILL